MDIEQGNKLIAAFMGYKLMKENETGTAKWLSGGNGYVWFGANFMCMEFEWRPEQNWNQLMPVVKKVVDSTCNLPTIELRKEARRLYEPIESQLCNFMIKGVHHYVVQYLKWYNTTNKN